MAPFILTALAGLIPQIASILIPKPGVGSEVAQRNAALARVAVDTVVKATTELTRKDQTPATAVEALDSDPALLEKVKKAVVTEPQIMQVLEVGGGIIAAREHDLKAMQSGGPVWRSPVFVISLILIPIVYYLVASLIAGGMAERLAAVGVTLPPWAYVLLSLVGAGWTGEARSGGFNLVIGLILGGICGVYYGVSVTQQRAQQNNDRTP